MRYVDDIYAVFDKDLGFQPFLNNINNQHANIKRTAELPEERENNILSFLDTRICIKGDEFEACVFRKSTNTDVLLNFTSMRPVALKLGVTLGSLNRAKLICSSPRLFGKEVNKMFQKNDYNKTYFDQVLNSFQRKHSGETVSVAGQKKRHSV